MNYSTYIFKRKVEALFIFPFIIVGKLIALLKPLKKEYKIFFFFPFYHTGGAEKVHALITRSIGNSNCIIYFTRKSVDNTFLNDFEKSGCTIKDISSYTNNKFLYLFNLIYRGIVTGYINTQKTKPVVFNGQCNFGYKISPWVKKDINQLELIHALNTFSYIRIPFIQFYKKSITVSQEIIDLHQIVYQKTSTPIKLLSNFTFIETKIELPSASPAKNFNEPSIKVIYVGRSTPDKRVHLAAMVASVTKQIESNIEFHFAGDVQSNIPKEYHSYCIFHGDVTDPNKLNELYNQSHILIVTSSTESGPLVILEAMARGLAIITTNVGFAPNYLQEGINGYKVDVLLPEQTIADKMSSQIINLYTNRRLLKSMSTSNTEIAFANFGIDKFHDGYKNLIASL